MTDNEVMKALECCATKGASCKYCPAFVKVDRSNCKKVLIGALNIINRLQAENKRLSTLAELGNKRADDYRVMRDGALKAEKEVERFKKLQKPTSVSGFKIENGKVIFFTNMLNGYRHEYNTPDDFVAECNLLLQRCYEVDDVNEHLKANLKTAKAEAYKEFAERLNADVFNTEYHLDKYYRRTVNNLLKELVGGDNA